MKNALKGRTQQPFFRKPNFFERIKALSRHSKKAHAQRIFNMLTSRQFDGWSFTDSTLCIAQKPSQEEIRQIFGQLKEKVNSFLYGLTSYYPDCHEISLEQSKSCPQVICAKVMVTLYDDMYLVSAVVLLRKNDDGTWQTVTEKPSCFKYFDEPKHAHTYKEFPKSVTVQFCGGFGDVNYVDQIEFEHNCDLFFAF